MTQERAEAMVWSNAPGLVAGPCQEVVWSTAFVALHRMILRAAAGQRSSSTTTPTRFHTSETGPVHELLKGDNHDLRWVLMVDSDMIPPDHRSRDFYRP